VAIRNRFSAIKLFNNITPYGYARRMDLQITIKGWKLFVTFLATAERI
jgi:hypothetical protein